MSETTSSSVTTNPEPSAPAIPAPADVNQELQALRALVIKLQSGLIALTWIVGVFIFIQFWRHRNELNVVRPQAAQIIDAAKRTDAPVNQFISQLVEYSRTHPDFAQILSRYPIQMPAATNPTAAPKPAATVPAPTTLPAAAPKK
jgi:hypothetical protein